VQPLDRGSECIENTTGFLRHGSELVLGRIFNSRNVALDDVFGHVFTSPFLILFYWISCKEMMGGDRLLSFSVQPPICRFIGTPTFWLVSPARSG
jgi:hypothetical protein